MPDGYRLDLEDLEKRVLASVVVMHLVRKYNPFKRSVFSGPDSLTPATSYRVLSPTVGRQTTPTSTASASVGKRSKAEKELHHLSYKIEKLLANLDEDQQNDANFTGGDECVICMSAKATMQTQPCGHRVVCRLCFVKTIQTAVAQRVLPLRCVVCRTKILKLKQSPPASSSSSSAATPARSRCLTQARATRHSGNTTGGGGGITTALSPRHSATGGSKLMQPLPIYPATNSGSSGVRGGTSVSSANSCHHHHLPLHHQAVQRRAITAWTSAASPPTGSDRDGSLPRLGATDTAFNMSGVVSTGGRSARRPTASSTTGHVDSPRISTTTPAGRVPSTGHDSKRIQRLK